MRYSVETMQAVNGYLLCQEIKLDDRKTESGLFLPGGTPDDKTTIYGHIVRRDEAEDEILPLLQGGSGVVCLKADVHVVTLEEGEFFFVYAGDVLGVFKGTL